MYNERSNRVVETAKDFWKEYFINEFQKGNVSFLETHEVNKEKQFGDCLNKFLIELELYIRAKLDSYIRRRRELPIVLWTACGSLGDQFPICNQELKKIVKRANFDCCYELAEPASLIIKMEQGKIKVKASKRMGESVKTLCIA